VKKSSITTTLIPPCGLDCGVCLGHLREKNHCRGCMVNDDPAKPEYCRACKIIRCVTAQKIRFCYQCAGFPCRRLKQLAKRYRERYKVDLFENLETIKNQGVRSFVKQEKAKWICPSCGHLLCVHRESCLVCGAKRDVTFG